MAVITLEWSVADIAETLTVFDVQKVYRSTAGEGGPYVEITSVATRVPLVAGQSVYTYQDLAGDPSYWYKTSFFNSGSSLESSLSDAIQGGTDPLYISVQDVRDAGLTDPPYSDAQILSMIKTMQGFIERNTRNFFTPKQMTLDVDGRGNKLMQLPWPIISVSALYINEDFDTAIDASEYEVYNGRGETERDDRRNPRIKLVSTETDIFTGTGPRRRSVSIFEVGEKNQRVVGTFGYVEPDGCVPEAIKTAMMRLVLKNISSVTSSGGGIPAAGPIIEEETDRHRRKYADPFVGSKVWSASGDPFVDQIIAAYRGPWKMGGPRTTWRRLTGGQVITQP